MGGTSLKLLLQPKHLLFGLVCLNLTAQFFVGFFQDLIVILHLAKVLLHNPQVLFQFLIQPFQIFTIRNTALQAIFGPGPLFAFSVASLLQLFVLRLECRYLFILRARKLLILLNHNPLHLLLLVLELRHQRCLLDQPVLFLVDGL